MADNGLDVIFSRLSVNVLFLTGYWSGNHAVAAIMPATGKPVLLVAETEYENVAKEADKEMLDIQTYSFESLTELIGITDRMMTPLPATLKNTVASGGIIGIEK